MSKYEWNYNIEEAPKGEFVKAGVGKFETLKHRPVKIIACSKDGKTVTKSRWIPEGDDISVGQWEFFGSNETPIAWMPYPEHPWGVEDET